MRKLALFMGIMVFSCTSVPGPELFYHGESITQLIKSFKSFTYSSDLGELPYRFFIPRGDKKTYPLILTLHGAGERGNDNLSQILKNDVALVWARQESQKENPAFILSPQCPLVKTWVGIHWNQSYYNILKIPQSKELKMVYNLIKEIVKLYPVDTKRIYITGISMGGIGTWDMVLRYPSLFAAAVPVCGFGDPTRVDRLKNLPLWVFHGAQDMTVPVTGSRMMVDAMDKEGYPLLKITRAGPSTSLLYPLAYDKLYFEYPGEGHDVWSKAYFQPELASWLFSQSKG